MLTADGHVLEGVQQLHVHIQPGQPNEALILITGLQLDLQAQYHQVQDEPLARADVLAFIKDLTKDD